MQLKFVGKDEGKEHTDKLDKDKQEKEKHEKEHKEKDHKEKDVKDVKDHKEKEHKEKDVKDYKDKEHKEKEHFIGEHPQSFMQAAVTQAPLAQGAGAAVPAKVHEGGIIPKALKWEFEKPPFTEKIHKEKNEFVEYVEGPRQLGPGDPIEHRLVALEAAIAQLVHFIPQEMRPDLSKGALRQESKTKELKAAKKRPAKAAKKR